MKITYTIVVIAIIALVGVAIGYNLSRPVEQPNLSSVANASENQGITFAATATTSQQIKVGSGSLSQIVINVLGTGNAYLYDATTTNVGLRAKATSSLDVVGVIAASQAVGTYIYDRIFVDGLLIDFDGAQGTSTIMYK